MPPPISTSTGIAITNPLVLYRALLATKKIDPDPAQHRLALELQKLYYKLKDYSPQSAYGAQIHAITQAYQPLVREDHERPVAVPSHPLRRNPLFSHLFAKKEERDTLALTAVLTSHEAAMKVDSPRGMLLYGEVGCGKSMLTDMLANSLPNKKKKRWHFNTFMLETLSKLEHRRHLQSRRGSGSIDFDHSLLWLAKDMIEKSPILFLDEFQLPDRAASKILSNLFTTFFQLGGVLIATSNRMPDELSKATGIDYTAPAKGSLLKGLLGLGQSKNIDRFPANNEFATFVEVLKARCNIYDLSGRDWRRRESEEMNAKTADIVDFVREEMVNGFVGLEKSEPGTEPKPIDQMVQAANVDIQLEHSSTEPKTGDVAIPKKYVLSSAKVSTWEKAVREAFGSGIHTSIPWRSTALLVYGRKVSVQRHLDGVTYWTFTELCGGAFGPADYITLASTFHTFILDDVHVLTIFQKNEARRFITLLDALYEARCKLVIRAEAGPDDLFFPETNTTSSGSWSGPKKDENDGGDAVYPETLSEIYQDQTSPFRPNVSIYTEDTTANYDPDEESGFDPVPGKGNEIGRQVDFGKTSSFVGEDERFAYKRAISRIWQMCGTTWNARSEPDWWQPLPIEVRRWERSSATRKGPAKSSSITSDAKLGQSVELDKPAGLQGKKVEEVEGHIHAPFREPRDPPTKIGWTHAWGMIKWGKKAGAWGQGVEGLDQRKDRK